MRNDDLSQSGNHQLTANDDYDVIPAGSGAGATGNTITGRGTVSGAAGADDAGAGSAHVTSITGAGGGDGSSMEAAGRYGTIKIDAQGNYTYTHKQGAPDNVEDVFTYTLADKSGALDSARLIIRIDGKEEAKIQDDAQRIVAGNEVITLPAGVELSDIHVVGRDLVIDLPDGTQMVITDGAVFVPQLALGDVEIPSDTLTSLLIDSEPRPAAGPPQSGGGNFAEPVAPLDPGVPLGDLLPPTEMDYTPPTFEETYIPQRPDEDDNTPEIFVQPDGQPASIDAVDAVDEGALAARGDEPAGSHSASTEEATSGNIVFDSPDGVDTVSITINGTSYVILGTGAVTDIPGDYGTLHINSVDAAAGTISYTYTLLDNVNHATDLSPWEDFAISLVDGDGDVATATLRINIADDAPIANPDVDSVSEDAASNVADGNVFSGSGGTDANGTDGVADVQGADGAHVSAFSFNGTAGVLGGASLAGNYGSLTMGANGLYSYALNNANPTVQALGAGETLTETYSYTIIDADGSTSTTTLTITINGANDAPAIVSGSTAVTEEAFLAPEDNQGNPDGVGNPTDTASSASANGSLSITDVDGDSLAVSLGAPAGTYYSRGSEIEWAVSPDGHTLTGSANGGSVIVVTIDNAGNYTVNLLEQIDHPISGTSPATSEDVLPIVVPVHANDGTVTVDGSLTVNVEDDSPIITGEATIGAGVDLDESDSGTPTLSPAGAITVTSTGAIISAPVSYGGDGPGGSAAYTLTLNGAVEGYKDSGLVTADGDHAITLHQIDATHIEGVFNDGSDHVAFTVTINASTGQVTVTQNYALEHSDDGSSAVSHNDTNSPLTLEGLINATVTYEDFDHDTVEATAEIGGGIRFFDDGPSVTVTVRLPDGQALDGLALVTSDDGTEGAGSTTDSTTVNFGEAFGLSADGGADGLKSSNLAFDLELIGAGDGPVDSGLDSHGATIYLYQVDANTIIGSTSATLAGADLGNTVFQLSTSDAGAVTLTQYQQVDHSAEVPSGSPFGDQFASLGTGLIRLAGTGTAVDNDDDTASDTEYLDLGGLVRFGDDGPAIEASLKQGAHLIVDESLPGTASGESEPAGTLGQVSVAISSLISITDTSVSADAPTTYSYALVLGAPSGGLVDSGLMTSAGDNPIYLYNVGGTIVGSTALTSGTVDASNTVFTVAISGGNVVLTQYQAVEQGDAPLNYNELSTALAQGSLGLQVTATDFDGDTATSTVDLGAVIQFNDDGPVATVTIGSLPTDPAALAAFQLETSDNGTEGAGQTSDSTTANFGGLLGLTADGGSDGAASTSLTFDLNLVGAGDGPIDSGLDSHGQTIYLYQINANTIVGSTSATAVGVAAGNTVFQLATSDGGAVTLTQYMQVDHSAEVPSGAPFGDQVTSLGGGLVQIVATGTVTDNDGDIATDTKSLDLGGLVRFADDGPAIDATIKGGASLHIDESVPGVDGAGETDATGLGQVTVALSAIVDIADTSVSADAPTTYGYALNLGPATGGLVASGLLTSDGNNPIYLYNVGGTIVGSTSAVADGSGINVGNTVFTVAISGGSVVMTQFQAIEHTNTSSFDENSLPLAGGALNLVITATDYDGDTATDSVDLGSIITFGDDGPVALDRSVPGTQPEDVNVVIDVSSDVDGGSDGLDHVEIVSKSGPGTLTFNPATGEFTYDPVDGEAGTVSFVYRVFDKDGDHDDATVTFDLAADSTPTVIVTDLTVDEKGLPNGTGELANAAPNTDNSETASGTMTITTGSDTLGAVEIQDKNGNWVDVTGATLGSPIVVEGSHGDLTVTSDGAGHYSYSYTLTSPYTHPDHFPAGVDGDAISGAADEIAGDSFAVRVTDNEGDMTTVTEATTINVTVRDDAPIVSGSVNAAGAVTLDETATTDVASTITLGTYAKGDDPNVANSGGTSGAIARTVSANAIVTPNVIYGADGPHAPPSLSYALNILGATSGLSVSDGTATGSPISLHLDGNVIVGVVDSGTFAGKAAFAIAINPTTGALTVEQYLSLQHPDGSNPDDSVGMLAGHVGVVVTATDGDLDQVSATAVDISTQIVFKDDGPSINVTADADAGVTLTTFDAQTIDPNTSVASSMSNFANLFHLSAAGGADGVKTAPTLSYDLSLGVAENGTANVSGLTSHGATIYLYELADGTVVGSTSATEAGVVAGNTIFSLSVVVSGAGAGNVTLTQFGPIDHSPESPSGAPYADQTTSITLLNDGMIKLTASATIVDQDNDSATDSETINIGHNLVFTDDGPDAVLALKGGVVLAIDETDGVTANAFETDPVGGNLGVAVMTASDLFTNASTYGGDGAATTGSAVYSLQLSSGSAAGSSLATTLLTAAGNLPITLYVMNDGSVVGSTAGSFAAVNAGNTVFSLSTNASGTVTMTQFQAIEHSNTSSYDESTTVGGIPVNGLQMVLTVKDYDQDTDTATVDLGSAIRFEDDGPSVTVNTVLGAVGEDALAGANVDAGDPKTTSSGPLSLSGLVNFGSDGFGDIKFDSSALLSQLGSQNLTSNGMALKYAVSPDGHTLTAYTGASVGMGNVFTVTLSGTNATFLLLDQIDHVGANLSGSGDDQVKTIDFSGVVKAYDGDGDSISLGAGSFKVAVEDDVPVLTSVTDQSVPNAVGVYHGQINFDYGADDPGHITLTPLTSIDGLTYSTDPDTGTITGSFGGNPYFTLSVDQTTGEYTLDVLTTRPVVTVPLDFTTIAPGKYDTVQVGDANFNGLTFTGTSVTSWVNPGDNTDAINPSGNGFGTGNNLQNDNDGFLFSYDDAAALKFDFNFQPNTSSVTISWATYATDPLTGGTVLQTGSFVVNKAGDADGIVPVTIDPSMNFDYMIVRFDVPSGTGGRVENFGVVTEAIPDNQVLQFGVTITDSDGDVVTSSTPGTTIDLTFQGGAPVPPVVLDTNHDGNVGFLAVDAGVLYDVNGDGHLDQTAWAASGDSILFRDADGNGTVSGANEFVFGGNGMTDLEALHAMYGAQLDAGDSDFTMFGLWNDANANGIVDGGEVSTLAEAGVTSIGLVSDGNLSSEAGGDVTVHGTTAYAYVDSDGNVATGKAVDASFVYEAGDSDSDQRIAANANTALLAVAAAAAGMASQAAAAPVSDEQPDAAAPAVNVAPSVTTVDPGMDGAQPQVSPLIANDDVQRVESEPAAHHNAVVAEQSDIVIDPAGQEDAAPQDLPQGTAPTVDMTPLVDVAPLTVMAEAAPAKGVDAAPQHNAVVSSEIIEQHDTAIEQVLAKFGDQGAIDSLAPVQTGGKAVQGWDMGDFAHLSSGAMEHIGAEAFLLHPDAVQPVMHG